MQTTVKLLGGIYPPRVSAPLLVVVLHVNPPVSVRRLTI